MSADSKFKDIIVDLEGCSTIFQLKGRGDGEHAPFLVVEAQAVVRELLNKAQETNCADLMTVRDGFGKRFEGCDALHIAKGAM